MISIVEDYDQDQQHLLLTLYDKEQEMVYPLQGEAALQRVEHYLKRESYDEIGLYFVKQILDKQELDFDFFGLDEETMRFLIT